VASNYWSSTTNANNTNNAWNVNFNNGNVNNNNKTNNNYVRAVRSGKCSLLSFRSVHSAYMDCRRRKRGTINALRFEIDASEKLFSLAAALQKGTYLPSRSVCFVTASPKLREVFAADFRDRVVHHLLVRELEKLYEPCFIHDSFACRVNKGTQAAVKRLREFMVKATKNRKIPAYFIQLDIRSFFTSIDKQILYTLLEQKLKNATNNVIPAEAGIQRNNLRACNLTEIDSNTLLELIRINIFHDCTGSYVFRGDRKLLEKIPPHKTLFKSGPDKGLPIGNLTSQFFANVYLNELDHFVKQTLRCRFYLRYVDDFILLDRSPEKLAAWREGIAAFLREKLALEIKEANSAKRVSDGADFLGYIVRPDYILVRRRVVNNLKAKLARYKALMTHEMKMGGRQVTRFMLAPETVAGLRQTIASYLGHFRHANAHNLTDAVFDKNPWLTLIFSLINGGINERLTYRGCFHSLKVQLLFYRARLEQYALLFQVGGFVELYGRDAGLAGEHFGFQVRHGFRGMDAVAGFPRGMAAKVIAKLVSAGHAVALIVEGGEGTYVKNRYVREIYQIAV